MESNIEVRSKSNTFAVLSVCLICAPAFAQSNLAEPEPVQHEFIIRNLKTESGAVLPVAHILYGTYGTLNAAGDNAFILPFHYMADMHGYGWLIGPGKALDPGKYFLVPSELFGNGRSSSPSNTAEPFHGPRFPVMTIRDNVNAVHALLTEQLHVKHLRAVIGFSIGAQQALQWAVSYPDYLDRIVASSGTAKTYGHGIVRLESEITAITTDENFKAGVYTAKPKKGILAFSIVRTAWLFSQERYRQELWKTEEPAGTTLAQVIEKYRTHFIRGADANNLILQMRTRESNDVGNTPPFRGEHGGDLERACVPSSCRCSTCRLQPISIFLSPTRAMGRNLFPTAHCCRSLRCGAIQPAQGKVRRRKILERAHLRFHGRSVACTLMSITNSSVIVRACAGTLLPPH